MTTEIRQPAADACTAGPQRAQQLAARQRKGVRPIINLRGPSERTAFDEHQYAERLGIKDVAPRPDSPRLARGAAMLARALGLDSLQPVMHELPAERPHD